MDVVIRRFKQLLIPFILITIIWGFIVSEPTMIFTTIFHSGNGYWFLWDLFWICGFFSVACYFSSKFKISQIATFLVVFVFIRLIKELSGGYFDAERIFTLYFVYVLGYLINKYKVLTQITESKYRLFAIFCIIISFILTSFLWSLSPDNCPLYPISLSSIVNTLPFRVLVSLLGCFSILLIFFINDRRNLILNSVGTCSLGLYVVHMRVLDVFCNINSFSI